MRQTKKTLVLDSHTKWIDMVSLFNGINLQGLFKPKTVLVKEKQYYLTHSWGPKTKLNIIDYFLSHYFASAFL